MDKSKPVLVVDDIQAVVQTVVNILEVLGFERFLEAQNGEQAMQVLLDNPDSGLIISDWRMPKLNGLDFLRWVRQSREFAWLPFLFLTSKSEAEDIALACDFGVTCYIIKPVTIQALQEKLQELEAGSPELQLQKALQSAQDLLQQDKAHEAEQELLKLQEQQPLLWPRTKVELGGLKLATGELQQAEELINRGLEVNSEVSKGWSLLAKIYAERSEYDQSQKSIQKALHISPENSEYQFQQAELHLAQGKLESARKGFQRALNTDPHNQNLKENIWNAYLQQDLVDQVEQDFGPYLFNHLGIRTINNQGVALSRQGRYQEAINLYKRGLKLYPQSTHLLYNLAVAHLNNQDTVKSQKCLQKAINLDPGFEQAKKLQHKLQKAQEKSI
ncbi:MAG: tetratricopeptide repeat protein [Desulfohalobiaceae bacterium]